MSRPRMPVDEVIAASANFFGLTPDDVKGPGRQRPFVLARAVICKILRDRNVSYPVMARLIGKKDHTTPINLIQSWDKRAKRHPEMLDIYNAISRDDLSGMVERTLKQAESMRAEHAKLIALAANAEKKKKDFRSLNERQVLAELSIFANEGLPCPSNREIAEERGILKSATVMQTIARLEYHGDISVERGDGWRIVTITATGKRTGKTRLVSQGGGRSDAGIYQSTVRNPAPDPVHRDTCFLCGTRMDLPSPRCARDHAMEMAA